MKKKKQKPTKVFLFHITFHVVFLASLLASKKLLEFHIAEGTVNISIPRKR